jgi:hypothetical protein
MLANPDNKVNLGFLLIISCSILLILSNHVVSFKTDLLTGFTGSSRIEFGRTRRPAPVGVRRRLKDFFTADRKGSFYPEKHVSSINLICAAAMGGGNHGRDPGRWVDLVEKPPGADTIPPYVRVWPFQSFDIRTS